MSATTALLSAADLEILTGKRRPTAQRRALDSMGVRYHTRPDGVPVVARSALDPYCRDNAADSRAAPNWSAIGG